MKGSQSLNAAKHTKKSLVAFTLTRLLNYNYYVSFLSEFQEVNEMTFMNRGMQNKRQRTAVLVIIGVVLLSFVVSIVAVSFI